MAEEEKKPRVKKKNRGKPKGYNKERMSATVTDEQARALEHFFWVDPIDFKDPDVSKLVARVDEFRNVYYTYQVLPTWSDFEAFLEERCVPRQRAGLREYLEALGLEEYDPLAIVQRTQGRMAEDDQWMEVERL